jgi:hypothetical protein
MRVTTNTTAPMAKTTRGRRCNSLKCQGELTSSDPILKPFKPYADYIPLFS